MARSLTAGTLSIVILAILAGLVGMYAFQTLMAEKDEDPEDPPAPQMVAVPIASTNLPPGRPIGLGDIALMEVKADELSGVAGSDDALKTLMLSADQIIGRVPRPLKKEDGSIEDFTFKQGEPFHTTNLYLEGQSPDISAEINPGERAVTLEFPDLSPGLVNTKDIVDVLFRSNPMEATQEGQLSIPETTITLLSEVRVVATHIPRVLDPDDTGDLDPPTVTLAVSLEDAKKIQAVQDRGDLMIVPRPDGEPAGTMIAATGVGLKDILGIKPPPPAPEPPAPPKPAMIFATEVYRRETRSLNMFREEGKPTADDDLLSLPTFDPSILDDKKDKKGAKPGVPPKPGTNQPQGANPQGDGN